MLTTVDAYANLTHVRGEKRTIGLLKNAFQFFSHVLQEPITVTHTNSVFLTMNTVLPDTIGIRTMTVVVRPFEFAVGMSTTRQLLVVAFLDMIGVRRDGIGIIS